MTPLQSLRSLRTWVGCADMSRLGGPDEFTGQSATARIASVGLIDKNEYFNNRLGLFMKISHLTKFRPGTKTVVLTAHGHCIWSEAILKQRNNIPVKIVDLDKNFRPLKMLFSYKWLIVKKSLGKYNFLYCGASLWGPETLHFFSHTKKFYLNTQRSNNEVNFWSDTEKDIWWWNSKVLHTYIKFYGFSTMNLLLCPKFNNFLWHTVFAVFSGN